MSEQLREQERIVGQRSALRYFDPLDKLDMSRLAEALRSEGADKWMVGVGMSDEDIDDWVREDGRGEWGKEGTLMAVVGSQTEHDEKGEVQGFVFGYEDENERVARWWKKGDVPKVTYEVSYGKRPGAECGQMASALRQFCVRLDRIKGRGRVKPGLVVALYVSPLNTDSIRVAEAAGFVKRSEVIYDQGKLDDPNEERDLVYVLDWYLLNEKMKEAGVKELGVRREIVFGGN